MFLNNKKYIAIALCASLLLPSVAFALPLLSDDPVPSQDVQLHKDLVGCATGASSGIFSILSGDTDCAAKSAASTFDAALKQISSVACISADVSKILGIADQVDQWSFGGLSLLTSSGQNAQDVLIMGKIQKLNLARSCIETQISSVKATVPVSILQAQQRQTTLDELTKQKNTIDARLDILTNQHAIAVQSIWKTIMVKVLISTTRAVTQRMVNNLTNKYRIQDFQKYADAVASQVYTNQLIRANAGNKADQLILRSMIGNPLVRNTIQSSIYNRAADAVQYNGEVFNPSKLDPADPHFYEKMAAIGVPEASPPYLQSVYRQNADIVQAQALANAKGEMSVSSGLKAPRNCTNAIGQQQGIDQQYEAVSQQVQDRGDLLQSLTDAKALGKPVSDDDIKKAQSDFDKANKQLQGLPDNYDTVALDICKEIVSPATVVDKVIDKFVSGYSEGLSKYNDNNLPLFANLISDIGTKLSTSIIFGDNINASVVTNTTGFDKTISTALNYGQYLHDEQQKNGILLSISDTGNADSATPYTEFAVEWDASGVSGVTAVSLSMNPLPFDNSGALNYPDELKGKNITRLNGTDNVNVYKPGQYTVTMKVYKGAVLFDTLTTKPLNYTGKNSSDAANDVTSVTPSTSQSVYTVVPPPNQLMKVGDTQTFTATILNISKTPVNFTNNIAVTVDDPTIASVKSTNGRAFTVHANAIGTATFTIEWTDPVTKQVFTADSFTITVTQLATGYAPKARVAGASTGLPLLIRGSMQVYPRGKP